MATGEVKKSNVREQATSRPDAKKNSVTMNKKLVKLIAHNAVPTTPPPAPEALSGPSELVACAPTTNDSRDALMEEKNALNKVERSSGFIFMCNTETKLKSFQYHVFGLPAEKKEVVEKIKEGTKLFLFDFDVKLLYGVYKATCQGQMNLEASAFGGRFPAQVRFSIHRDCIPVPESAFKSAIKDNYRGSEFEPELSAKQVRRLIPLLRWCAVPTAPPVAPYLVREPPRQENYDPYLLRPPPPVDPHLSQYQYSHRVEVVPRVEPPLPHLVRPSPLVDPYPLQFTYSHHVDVVAKVEPPLPCLVGPPPPVNPYPSQFQEDHHVDVVPKIEPPRPLPHLVGPSPPVDYHPSQFQYSHLVDVMPKVEPPLPHLVRPPPLVVPHPSQFQYSHPVDVVLKVNRPPPPLDPHPSQFQYSHPVDVEPKVDHPPPHLVRPPPLVDPYLSQFQYSHHVDVVTKVEHPLPHLVRPPPPVDHNLSQFQYRHHIDVVPRIEPPLPIFRHELYGNAGTMGLASQTMEHQSLPAHPSDQYYVVENRHSYLPEYSNQFVQDQCPSNSTFQLPGFRIPAMSKDEYEDKDKSSDSDDGSFESLTPEHDNGTSGEHEIISSAVVGKNQHILEEVDGELEMEDVSPTGDITRSSTSNNVVCAAQSMPRYGGIREMVHPGMESVPHRSILQGKRGSELQEATEARYCNSYRTSAVPINTHSTTATGYHSYPSTITPHAQTLTYSFQSVGSGRTEQPTSSVPVSSYYSFSGAKQVYS